MKAMSGSSDNTLPPPRVVPRPPAPGTGELAIPEPEATPEENGELVAPVRDNTRPRQPSTAPIVPAGSVTGRSLTLVISIMCFLACLTAGAVYMVNQSAAAWMQNICQRGDRPDRGGRGHGRRKTPRRGFVLPGASSRRGQRPPTYDGTVSRTPGALARARVRALRHSLCRALSHSHSTARRRRSWTSLPLNCQSAFPERASTIIGNGRPRSATVTRSLALGGLAILVLVGAATTAIIVSATRSSMASNREIVEVLHFVGATDRFIAREFEKHFLALGIRAALSAPSRPWQFFSSCRGLCVFWEAARLRWRRLIVSSEPEHSICPATFCSASWSS